MEVAVDVRFGSKADMCSANRHVRFSPNSDRENEFPQGSFAKADIYKRAKVNGVRVCRRCCRSNADFARLAAVIINRFLLCTPTNGSGC